MKLSIQYISLSTVEGFRWKVWKLTCISNKDLRAWIKTYNSSESSYFDRFTRLARDFFSFGKKKWNSNNKYQVSTFDIIKLNKSWGRYRGLLQIQQSRLHNGTTKISYIRHTLVRRGSISCLSRSFSILRSWEGLELKFTTR